MRGLLLLILIALLHPVSTIGQLKLGVKAGIQYSNLKSYNQFNIDAQWAGGFQAGLIADVKTLPFLHLQTQLNFSSIAYRSSNVEASDGTINIGTIGLQRINYLQIPLYALVRIGLKNTNLKLGGGPYFSFKLEDKIRIQGGDTFRGTLSARGTSGIRSNVNGWALYGSAEFRRWLVALQFQQTFKGIYNNLAGSNLPDWKMGTIGLSLGYFLLK